MATAQPPSPSALSRIPAPINVAVDFGKGRRTPNRDNLAAIRRALEEAGVEFLDDGVMPRQA